MSETPCARLIQEFPQRVPLKVIGRGAELDPERILALIQEHLGLQPATDCGHTANQRGAYTSLTFWVTLPDEGAELPLRQAIQALPGVVMQL
jgi:putative lipoic acid-binding regulatory protein